MYLRTVIFAALLSTGALYGQDIPQLKAITGGTFTMGGGYQYVNRGYKMHLIGPDTGFMAMHAVTPAIGEVPEENNPDRRVTVASFFMAEKEVTNKQYRDFLIDHLLSPEEKARLKADIKAYKKEPFEGGFPKLYEVVVTKAGQAGLAPSQACWSSEFAYSSNSPLTTYYFTHEAFDSYPVVGVSWDQANAYCGWLSEYANRQLAAKGKPSQPAYRLPTEAEWEYAARVTKPAVDGESHAGIYPFEGRRLFDAKGQYLMNIKTGNGDYIGDNYEYTSPVGSFPANGFGLHDMGGNVAEWVADVFRPNGMEIEADLKTREKPALWNLSPGQSPAGEESRVAKGGSWADYHHAAMCGSRASFLQEKGYSRVGFRVAMTKAN